MPNNHVRFHLHSYIATAQAEARGDKEDVQRLMAQSKLRLCIMTESELKQLAFSLSSERTTAQKALVRLQRAITIHKQTAAKWLPYITKRPFWWVSYN